MALTKIVVFVINLYLLLKCQCFRDPMIYLKTTCMHILISFARFIFIVSLSTQSQKTYL